MALEKTRTYKILKSLEDTNNTKKAKRNKHQPECYINRYKGCGICGSLNICYQGVKTCNVCGEEIEILTSNDWIYADSDCEDLKCECIRETIRNDGRVFRFRDTSLLKIGKCIDCGAVESSFCPNGKRHDCWKSGVGNKKFCQMCGFRKG